MSHRGEHIQKQTNARLQIELELVAILIDCGAIDVLEDEIRLAGGGNAGIKGFCNVGMSEPAKDATFTFESFFRRGPDERDVHELYRSLPLEPAVAATGEPDVSHSALANRRDQSVGTERLACESCRAGRCESSLLQKTFLPQHAMFVEKRCQLCSQCGILLIERGQPRAKRIVGHGKRLIQIGT